MHVVAVFRSVEGAGGWSQECPAAFGLASERCVCPPVAVLWRGSKQERHPRIRSARRGGPLLTWEDVCVHYWDRPEEQLFLDRLAVFADTFDFEAVESVCGGDEFEAFDLDDLLAALLDKSLVTPVQMEGRTRYRLLETIRDYGLGHLDERDETQLASRTSSAVSPEHTTWPP